MSLDLTVAQDLSTNAQPVLDQHGNRSALAIGSNRVGIRTTSPETTLDVHGIIRTWHKDHDSATWDNLQLWSDDDKSYLLASGANKGLYIEAQDEKQNKTNVLIQPNGGNVGIGTSDPEGKLDVRGDIRAGNSDIYFTKTDHKHTGIGNTAGYAAIENAADYDALMILGRAGTSKGRYVKLWDYLQVNGGLEIATTLKIGNTEINERELQVLKKLANIHQ